MMSRVLSIVSSNYCGGIEKIDRNAQRVHEIVYYRVALRHKWRVGKSLPGKADGIPGWGSAWFYVVVFLFSCGFCSVAFKIGNKAS